MSDYPPSLETGPVVLCHELVWVSPLSSMIFAVYLEYRPQAGLYAVPTTSPQLQCSSPDDAETAGKDEVFDLFPALRDYGHNAGDDIRLVVTRTAASEPGGNQLGEAGTMAVQTHLVLTRNRPSLPELDRVPFMLSFDRNRVSLLDAFPVYPRVIEVLAGFADELASIDA